MIHPKIVAARHPQIAPKSCVAWGAELVLLTFERQLPSPQPQKSAGGFGFHEAQQVLADCGVGCTVRAFGEDFGAFERAALATIRNGGFPIVTMPSYVYYDREDQGMAVMCHTYAVYEDAGSVAFVTREYGVSSPSYWTHKEFEKMRFEWTGAVKALGWDSTDLLHALFPQGCPP